MSKEIKFTKHALKQANDRGSKPEEITDTILTGKLKSVKYNRFSAVKVFEYDEIWEGSLYKRKEVNVIFTEEDDRLIVITAIMRYFKD